MNMIVRRRTKVNRRPSQTAAHKHNGSATKLYAVRGYRKDLRLWVTRFVSAESAQLALVDCNRCGKPELTERRVIRWD